ncbi:MAG: AAA family ATPase [Bacteroidota bacterium]
MIIAVYGLPGTGKSTFAKELASRLNACHIDSDRVRVEMGLQGKYDLQSKYGVYRKMAEKMEMITREGKNVIIDSTLFIEEARAIFIQKADEIGTTIHFVEIKAGELTIRHRLKNAKRESEADYEVYQKIKNDFEPYKYSHLIMYSDILLKQEMQTMALGYLKN